RHTSSRRDWSSDVCSADLPALGDLDEAGFVVGTHTEPGLVEVAKGWVAGLGKTAITVKDSPGFASSRLGVALALEAMRMVEEGRSEERRGGKDSRRRRETR